MTNFSALHIKLESPLFYSGLQTLTSFDMIETYWSGVTASAVMMNLKPAF